MASKDSTTSKRESATFAEAIASIRETADSGVMLRAGYIKNLATCLHAAFDGMSVEPEQFEEFNTCFCLVDCMSRYADDILKSAEQIIDAAISAREVA
jgi:hypothetical protein